MINFLKPLAENLKHIIILSISRNHFLEQHVENGQGLKLFKDLYIVLLLVLVEVSLIENIEDY